MTETIKNINIDLLIPFENHPFKKRDGVENEELKDSVNENGLLQPIIVRSFSASTFEIISGHRRVEACKEFGDANRSGNSKRYVKRRSGNSNGGFKFTERTPTAKRKSLCLQNEA